MKECDFFYKGNSMKGVFILGDFLHIDIFKIDDLNPGDVIAFKDIRENSKNDRIVHRIVKISNNALITMGDNNRNLDFHQVTPENLIGKVISYERDGKKYKVRGGLPGFYQAKIKYFIRRSIFWFYKKLTNISFIRSFLRLLLNNFFVSIKKIKKIKVNSIEGSIIKWSLNGKTIAKKGPDVNDFYIQKPFDLIIK